MLHSDGPSSPTPSADLSVLLGRLRLPNPILVASGTFGYGREMTGFVELARRGGSVVNIAGVGGKTPGAEFTIGGSVNAALLSFTKALADVGVRDGVQVNAINPGTVRTDRFEKRLDGLAAERALTREAAEAWFVASQRVTRVGEPTDIAGLVAFLVGPEGRFLHGALIDMDGGATKSL